MEEQEKERSEAVPTTIPPWMPAAGWPGLTTLTTSWASPGRPWGARTAGSSIPRCASPPDASGAR
jgi:hypothetical protein